MGDLTAVMQKSTPSNFFHTVVMGLSTGLEYLHSKGILHRDVKPDNILIQGKMETCDLVVKLTDFGLSTTLRFPAPFAIAMIRFTAQVQGRRLGQRKNIQPKLERIVGWPPKSYDTNHTTSRRTFTHLEWCCGNLSRVKNLSIINNRKKRLN